MTANRKLLFFVNEGAFFGSHRLPLAQEANRRGFEVVVVCGEGTGEAGLERLGIRTRTVRLSRSGFNPLREWRTFRELLAVYRAENPDIVHHVTIKPVIYGTRVARRIGVPAVVNAIPGLGFVFTQSGFLGALRRTAVNALYRFALVHPRMRLVFQNREDMLGFAHHGIGAAEKAYLIRGSGVDLAALQHSPEPPGSPRFVLVARMLKDKGVREFVEAARLLKVTEPDWTFELVGDVDPGNPASLVRAELERWRDEGIVRWSGYRSDVGRVLAESHVVCLPSYREGLPKSLLEGAASGRAMIATDVPGCREVVRDGVTGLLVPPRDARALAEAMRRLGEDPGLRRRLGKAAREKAEILFSVEDVVRDTFLIYDELLQSCP